MIGLPNNLQVLSMRDMKQFYEKNLLETATQRLGTKL